MPAQGDEPDCDGGRDEERDQREEHADDRTDPRAGRVDEEHRKGDGHREYAGGMSAGKAQETSQLPVDERFEQFGEGRGGGYGYRYEHSPAASPRHQAGDEQHSAHDGHRKQTTEAHEVKHRQTPADEALNPGVDRRVQPSRPRMAREPRSKEHRERYAEPGKRSGQGTHGCGQQRVGHGSTQPFQTLAPVPSCRTAILRRSRAAPNDGVKVPLPVLLPQPWAIAGDQTGITKPGALDLAFTTVPWLPSVTAPS